jgi:predicted nucleic acid-binding protein
MATPQVSILVDASAWIDFLREGAEKHPGVAAALESGQAALCPVAWAELWSGARGKREESVLRAIREATGWLEIDGMVWELATKLLRQSIDTGWVCPLADVLMVACAQRHGTQLLHQDKHIRQLLDLVAGK